MNHYISILVIDRLLFRKKKTTNMMSDDDNLNVDIFFVILSLVFPLICGFSLTRLDNGPEG